MLVNVIEFFTVIAHTLQFEASKSLPTLKAGECAECVECLFFEPIKIQMSLARVVFKSSISYS